MPEFGYKRHPGDKTLAHGAWNRLVQKQTLPKTQSQQYLNQPRDYDLIQLENATINDALLEPFGVVEVKDATWTERQDPLFLSEGMRRGVELKGQEVETEWDNIALSQKSSPPGMFSPGVISGPTPCYVFYPDQSSLAYPFAIPIPGNVNMLKASPYGLNRILWHAEPQEPIEACAGAILQSYVNMGEDGQWVFFLLQEDLSCCGSANALLVDNCGNQVGECPIYRTVHATISEDICQCENSCKSWKAGDVVPCWWYQYLQKWVTIPNFNANVEKKSVEVITDVTLSGLTFQPKTTLVEVVDNVAIDITKISLETTTQEVDALLEGTLTGSCNVFGTVTTTGTNTLTGTIPGSAFTATGTVTLADELSITSNAPLTGGTPQEVVTGVSFIPASITQVPVAIPVYENPPTFTGSLDLNGTKTPIPVTGLSITHNTPEAITDLATCSAVTLSNNAVSGSTPVVSDLTFDVSKLNLNFSGVSFSVNLSSLFESKQVVTSISLSQDGCTITAETESIMVLKSGANLTNIPVTMSGIPAISMTANPVEVTQKHIHIQEKSIGRLNVGGLLDGLQITGNVEIPTEVEGEVELEPSAVVALSQITNFNGGAINVTKTPITIPTTAEVSIAQEVELSGDVGFAVNDIPISVTGPVTCTGTVDIEGTVSVPLSLETTLEVEVPNQLNIDEGFLVVETVDIPLVEVAVTQGTISTGKTTIEYLGCGECDE